MALHVDWSLRHCSRNGHVTYRPDEPELAQRLRADTVAGEAWRCLRCGDFVPGEPTASGPADSAPRVPRGRALRDLVIMRLLAVERAVKGSFLLLLALVVWRFKAHSADFAQAVHDELPLLKPAADRIGWDIEHSWIARVVQEVADVDASTLTLVGFALLAYGFLQWGEAVGLWLAKRWGEYLAVIATSAFLPLEIRELVDKVTLLRVVLLVVNIAAVVWLVWSKRLFGVRGGAAAHEAQHHAESLINVERAALMEQGPASQPAEARV